MWYKLSLTVYALDCIIYNNIMIALEKELKDKEIYHRETVTIEITISPKHLIYKFHQIEYDTCYYYSNTMHNTNLGDGKFNCYQLITLIRNNYLEYRNNQFKINIRTIDKESIYFLDKQNMNYIVYDSVKYLCRKCNSWNYIIGYNTCSYEEIKKKYDYICCVNNFNELIEQGELIPSSQEFENYRYISKYLSKEDYKKEEIKTKEKQERRKLLNAFNNDFPYVQKYFNEKTENGKKFRLIDKYTIKCKHGHISKLRFNNRTDCLSTYNIHEPMECYVCKLVPKFMLFKLLHKLKANYYIKEIYVNSNDIPRGLTIDQRYISSWILLFYNDKKHLTGKIVFNDLYGEQQAKANSNNLVFRWMSVEKIDDLEFCKSYLYEFFNEINKKHNLENK